MAEDTGAARVDGLDLARGLAVLGMVVVNFKYVLGLEGSETGLLGALAAACDGRAAATFVTLAGMGVSLMARRALGSGDPLALAGVRRVLLRRAAFLFALGVLDMSLWPGDILHFYAVYLVLAALLLAASDAALLAAAAGSVLGFLGLFFFLDYEAGWDWAELRYAAPWSPRGLFRHLFFNGYHPVFPWIAFLLAGMVLGRRGWGGRRARLGLAAGGLALTVAAEAASAVLSGWAAADGTPDGDWCALVFGTQSMPPSPMYVLSGGGSALAVIGLSLEAAAAFPAARALALVRAAGQMALTLYAAHVVFGLAPLGRFGPADGSATLVFSLAASGAFYAAALGFVRAWRRRFERGPLESLMRRWAG